MITHFKTIANSSTHSLTFAKQVHRPFSLKASHIEHIISFYSNLINHCLSLKSLITTQFIHAHLIKRGLHQHTFLGNRLVSLYSNFGSIDEALQAFRDIPRKNSTTWNILLTSNFKVGRIENACHLFDEMPERDIVSWNSMISGYALNGLMEYSLGVFLEMQEVGMRPNGFTLSIMVSCVASAHHGKQIHGNIIRSSWNPSNIVLGNSLIDMYGKLGLVDYAFGVFITMAELDVISWNSMISGCDKSGYGKWALEHYRSMRIAGFSPDQFTISTVTTVCAKLQDLEKGKQVFAQCIQMGYLSNSIVSSAVIDMLSKCDRLEDSIRLFEQMPKWDSALCNSMISVFARHGLAEEAIHLFVLSLRENLKPTEFTFGSILNSISWLFLPGQGTQLHSLVIKLGSESDIIVSSSLVDMYAKSGFIDFAMKIFSKMGIRDLVSWNTMIIGLARNGRAIESLQIFSELNERGPPPDRITLSGVLSACSHAGLIDEGKIIFSSMEEKYGIIPGEEHYIYMVDMFGRAGKLTDAMHIIESMPYEPNALILDVLLNACEIHGNVKLTERVAERVMDLDQCSSLPYLVLLRIYGTTGRWESMARARKAMRERGVKKVSGCSWIGISNHVYAFKENQILHCGGEDTYSILKLLVWEMQNEGYVS